MMPYTATPTNNYSSKFFSTGLSFFFNILSHFCLYLIPHISCHCSLFLHPTVLLIHIFALLFLNLLSEIWCHQISLPSHLNMSLLSSLLHMSKIF